MTDSDEKRAQIALSLIEQHHWAVSPQAGGGWVIDTSYDGEAVHEIARTRGTLLEAVDIAEEAQRAGRYLREK
ncbi:hypothetical protein [Oceaniradius stylonematis]|uniref:hypothetical protein n=1 Tax=Oceaniradius stylonematis TaxID=2184161 RepID=UPI00273ECFDC|nr:hypothetical protein [Oceaniradius stylonematis]